MQNIGVTFVKMGQYNDAITSFEHIMVEEGSFRTGFNLILCYFALGDRDKMKRTFQKLLTVDMKVEDDDKYTSSAVSFTCSSECRYCSFPLLG
jgi:intraflagellar transport protein 88